MTRRRATGPAVAWLTVTAIAIGVAASLYEALRQDTTVSNMHAVQADAFLNGRLDLDRAVEDVAVYEGKVYSP